MATDKPPAYSEATKDAPPAYESLFPINQIKEARDNSSNKGTFMAKLCEIICGSFACLCCLLLLAALPVAMIVIGAIYINDCEGQRFIPIWLVVFGSVSVFHTLVSSFKYVAKIIAKKTDDEENTNEKRASRGGNCCESILSLFLFIWTIVGSVWVFGYFYSVWSPLDCTNNFNRAMCGCNPVVFTFSYATLIVMYAVSLLICCCGCFCIVCIGLFAAGAASGDDD